MVSTLKATEINLRYLGDRFGLKRVRDPRFFGEWQDNLPELDDRDRQALDKIREGYFNLVEYPPLLENAVKLTVVSPLLFVAGLYLPPFRIQCERSIQLQAEEDGVKIEGKIDILVLKDNFWVTVIEAKQVSFSLESGLAQLLAYMLADPNPTTPTFGLLTNGANFRFVKLDRQESPKYALSDVFAIDNQDNNLYTVLQILRRSSQL